MSSPRTISALFSERLLFTAEQLGVQTRPLWQLLGVSRAEIARDVLLRVDEGVHLALWHRTVQLTGDPALALRYADSAGPDSYGVLGLAAKTAPNVGYALAVAARYVPSYAASMRMTLSSSRGLTNVTLASLVNSGVAGVRYQIESGLAELWRTMQRIASAPLPLHSVAFTHEAPGREHIARYQDFFGVTPTFAASWSGLVVDDDALRTPCLRADAGLHRFLCEALEHIAPTSAPTSIADRCHAVLLAALPAVPLQPAVARALGVSQRDLQRKLADDGTTFARILDNTRRGVAEAMLRDTQTSLAEVAAATGFSEASAFSRAFVRWTGRRPTESQRTARSPRSPRL